MRRRYATTIIIILLVGFGILAWVKYKHPTPHDEEMKENKQIVDGLYKGDCGDAAKAMRELYEDGKYPELLKAAREGRRAQLEKLKDAGESEIREAKSLFGLWEAKALVKLERAGEIGPLLEAVVVEEDDTEAAADIAYLEGALAGASGDEEAKTEAFKKLYSEYRGAAAAVNAAKEAGVYLADVADNLFPARVAFNVMLENAESEEDAAFAKKYLTELNEKIVFSRTAMDQCPTYAVAEGEYADAIGAKYDVPGAFLLRINGIADPTKLRAGKNLKVVKGPFHVVVETKNFTLTVYTDDGIWVKEYPVGLGKDDSTPRGEFIVADKVMFPTWYPPDGSPPVPYGDNHIIGPRWIEFNDENRSHSGYGIHGTNNPSSIGRTVSLGCVRMKNEDVEELFDILIRQKSRVTIK